MMKRIFAMVLSFAMLLSTMTLCVLATGGEPSTDDTVWDGTSVDTTWYTNDPTKTEYEISTAAQVAGIAKLVNTDAKTFEGVTLKLTKDIDLNNKAWTPIGFSKFFYGMLDGNGKTISNLKIDTAAAGKQAFIGILATSTTGAAAAGVKNLTLKGSVNSTGTDNIGMLIGTIYANKSGDILIQNVYAEGSVTGKKSSGAVYVGGICGNVNHGKNLTVKVTIQNVVSNVTVVGGTDDSQSSNVVGGIIGRVQTGTVEIDHCINNGTVSAKSAAVYNTSSKTYSTVGGIVGTQEAGSITVSNCLNTAAVTSTAHYAGGIAGQTKATTTISNCINQGVVTKGPNAGGGSGIYGAVAQGSMVENCYHTEEVVVNQNLTIKGVSAAAINNAFNNALAEAAALTDYRGADAAVEKVIGAANVITKTDGLVGIQQSAIDENKFNIRFVAKVADTVDKAAVGFKLTAYNVSQTQDSTTVYTSINAIGSDGRLASVSASDLGGAGLYAVTLQGVPADITITITVQTYTKATQMDSPAVVDTYDLTFTNGVLTSCEAPTATA